jgi:hypothetical protein
MAWALLFAVVEFFVVIHRHERSLIRSLKTPTLTMEALDVCYSKSSRQPAKEKTLRTLSGRHVIIFF